MPLQCSIRRRATLLLTLLAPALLALATPAQAGSLNVIVAGPGAVSLDPPSLGPGGVPDETTTCEVAYLQDGGNPPCLFDYPVGTTVTLTATPSAEPTASGHLPSFARWSPLECFGVTQCRVTVGDETDIVAATFNPLRVKVAPFGPGSVTSDTPGLVNCAGGDGPHESCDIEVPFGAPVTLTAHSDDTIRWRSGCDSVEGAVCHTSATSDPWWVFPEFGPDSGGANQPPRVKVRLSVSKAGNGTGSISGPGIDCGTTCSAEYDEFGQRARFVATPTSGSTFGGWRGACGSDPACVIPVGAVGSVRAVFDKPQTPPATPTPPPPPPPPPATATTLVVGAVRASATGRRGKRAIVVRVTVNRSVAAALQLVRGATVLTSRGYSLRAGANRLRLRVPRQVPGGRAVVVLRVGRAPAIRRKVRLAR